MVIKRAQTQREHCLQHSETIQQNLMNLGDFNLPPDSDQDQREAGSDNQRETSLNHVPHQRETVLHGSEGETTTDTIPNPSVTMRSGRNIRRTQWMEESTQQHEQGIVAWEVLNDQDEVKTKPTQNDQFILQRRLSNPIAFAASADPLTALSTTEAEYIALSTACRELIPMLELMKEMHFYHIKSHPARPKLHCKVFEDNSGALEMAHTPKL